MSVEALWEGAELRACDAETHPPDAPGVRWLAGGGGAGQGALASALTCCVPSRRQAEPEQSDGDGEEDFYYTELDMGLDALTDGLSSLTPMPPTASMLPVCPHVELSEPGALPGLLHPLALSPPPGLGSVATAQVCRSDHAYQVGEVTGSRWGRVSGCSGGERDHHCASSQGCLAPTQLEPQPTTGGACMPTLPSKLGASLRCVCVF